MVSKGGRGLERLLLLRRPMIKPRFTSSRTLAIPESSVSFCFLCRIPEGCWEGMVCSRAETPVKKELGMISSAINAKLSLVGLALPQMSCFSDSRERRV